MMKKLIKKISVVLAPYLAYVIIKILKMTVRFDVKGFEAVKGFHEKGQSIIMSFWHGRLLMMPLAYKGKGISILISMHDDGEMIARAMELFDFSSIRGSTTRGATQALRKMVRTIKTGSDIAITPDGPKGPRETAQNGAVILAKMSGAPICPVTYGVSKKKRFKSWDGFILPYPFSRGVFIWGAPIFVDADAKKDELEKKRVEFEKEMKRIREEADSYF